MARDGLGVLARLRARERDAARLRLAEAQATLMAAEARDAEARAQLAREAGAAPADYAAWLPAAQRDMRHAAAAVTRAIAAVEAARQALLEARIATDAIETLRAARHEAERRARIAAAQRALEDAARGMVAQGAPPRTAG